MEQVKVKLNPVRLRIPKYGNGLMLLMEQQSNDSFLFIGKVENLENHFDIQIKGSKHFAQSIKEYINENL